MEKLIHGNFKSASQLFKRIYRWYRTLDTLRSPLLRAFLVTATAYRTFRACSPSGNAERKHLRVSKL